MIRHITLSFFFFFNDTATTEIYTLSLHDALPISSGPIPPNPAELLGSEQMRKLIAVLSGSFTRSEEHTSELQSRLHLVCRLLLEKKKSICRSRTPPTPRYFDVFC